MARAMWRGAIQFGLVTIPLKLYLATESKGISFNMLHASCLNRIQMKTYCPFHDEVIARSETVKGYEYAPGQYVVVTDEDLASVPLRTVRSIEIEQFVRADDAGVPRFARQAYYLEPEPIGRKAFELLRSVLSEQGLAAVAKVVIKDREALAVIDPFGPTMILTTLLWPDEVRPVGELDLPDSEAEIKPAERKMAEQLVAAMTGEFDADAHHDAYREALMTVIEAKVEGREVAAPQEAETSGTLVDLMAVLEASVAAVRAQQEASPVRDLPAARKGRKAEGVAAEDGEAPRRAERRRKTA